MTFEQDLLDLARREADEAEVYSVASDETPVSFEANRLKGINSRSSRTTALRIIKNGRTGLATGAGAQDPMQLLEFALETAAFGAEARFHMPPPSAYPSPDIYDPAVEALTLEQMVQAGQFAIDKVVAHTPGIICEGSVVKRRITLTILNSAGLEASSRKTTFSARLEGTLVRGTDMLFVGDQVASCRPELDLSPIVRQTIRQLEHGRDTVAAPHGDVPVVLTPRSFAQTFSSPLTLGFSGKTVLQGASPLGHRRGERCFDARITMHDDPTHPFRPGSRPFDDEGVPSQRLPLIQQGVVQGFVYDLQTAALAGASSTGSATRAATSLPSPDLSVLIVDPGEVSLEDLISAIPDGLVVEEMIGSSQGNVLGGDFSGNVLLGYRIEHGQITGRVKDTMMSGNVYRVLEDIIALSSDARWVGGNIYAPAFVCRNVSVSTKS